MKLSPRGKALSSILFALHDKPERVEYKDRVGHGVGLMWPFKDR